MRAPRTTSAQPPQMHRPTRTVHTVIVCLPDGTATANLRPWAIGAVLNRRIHHPFFTEGVVPHFAVRTRRTTKLVDCWQGLTSGGPVKLLDLDAMRRNAVAAAAAEWLLWDAVVKGTKPAQPFWFYADRHRAEPGRYPLDRARRDYLAQPRILAMAAYNAIPRQPCPLPTSALEAFQAGHTSYLNLAWLAAVPADVLAPEHGGYLSTGSERLADQLDYLRAANAHLAGLRPDTPLVAVAVAA